jgi:GntR family transcriptional regulator
MHEQVLRIRRVRLSEGKPFMLEHVAMPAALFPGLAQGASFSHRIVILAQHYGILLGKGEERVTLAAASEEVANALQLAVATPLLVLDRTVHNLQGRPIEWRLGHCEMSNRYYLAEFH